MIQDIFPYKLINHFENFIPSENDTVLVFDGLKILAKLCSENNGVKLIFPKVKDFSSDSQFIYLFSIEKDDEKIRYFWLKDVNQKVEGFDFEEVRQIRDSKVDHMYKVYAMMTGKHLKDWYSDNKFCGRCGNPTVHSKKERAMICSECGYTIYPRIMPAVIVGVTNKDKLLLTKYKTGYGHNALIAGFTEIGETMEETVEREVMEEAGIKVKNIRYYKSQPWGLANDILAGYFCEVDGNDSIKMDENELKEARWVKREDIELQPTNVSLTNEMMMIFKNGQWPI